MANNSVVTMDLLKQFQTNVKNKVETKVGEAKDIANINSISIGANSKNFLQLNCEEITVHGLTFTPNADGTITVNGTVDTTENFSVYMNMRTGVTLASEQYDYYQLLPPGEYICSGGHSGIGIQVCSMTSEDTSTLNLFGAGTNNELRFTVTDDMIYTWTRLRVYPEYTITYDNFIIKPMIRRADITDDTFVKYQMPLQEQIDDIDVTLSSTHAAVSSVIDKCCKNLIKPVAGTYRDVTITVDDSGQIILNGTNTASSSVIYKMSLVYLEAGVHYVFVDELHSDKYYVHLRDSETMAAQGSFWLAHTATKARDFTVATSRYYLVAITMYSGDTYTDFALRPMICRKDEYDMRPEFVRYKPTGEDLQTQIDSLHETTATSEYALINRVTLGYTKRNYLKINAEGRTRSDVTAVVNDDGSITLNGTSSSTSTMMLFNNLQTGASISGSQHTNNKKWIPTGEYIMSLGTTVSGVTFQTRLATEANSEGTYASCTTGEAALTVTDEHLYVWNRILISAGASFDNVTIYPMIRLKEDTDSSFASYNENVDTRINNINQNISVIQNTLGYEKKNLLIPVLNFSRIGQHQSSGNAAVIVNDDYSVTFNGSYTITAWNAYCTDLGVLWSNTGAGTKLLTPIKPGDYILSGCPSGGSASSYCLICGVGNAAGQWMPNIAADFGDGCTISVPDDGFEYYLTCVIQVPSGESIDLTFKPMLRKATDDDATYEPPMLSVYEALSVIPVYMTAIDGTNFNAPTGTLYRSGHAITGCLTINGDGMNTEDATGYWKIANIPSLKGYYDRLPLCAVSQYADTIYPIACILDLTGDIYVYRNEAMDDAIGSISSHNITININIPVAF